MSLRYEAIVQALLPIHLAACFKTKLLLFGNARKAPKSIHLIHRHCVYTERTMKNEFVPLGCKKERFKFHETKQCIVEIFFSPTNTTNKNEASETRRNIRIKDMGHQCSHVKCS